MDHLSVFQLLAGSSAALLQLPPAANYARYCILPGWAVAVEVGSPDVKSEIYNVVLDVQSKCHPQTLAVCQTRADGLGLEAVLSDEDKFVFGKDVCGVLIQYPATDGSIHDYKVRSIGAQQTALRC